jgi:UDP:flavonoid glycosyltransferase YjiC (YdhE family)
LKRVLYAWELGSGLGHVSRFFPLALELERRGCAVTWALTDAAPAAALLKDRINRILRAPRMEGYVTGLPEPQLAYSEVLLRHGYLSAASLTPLLRDWRALIAAVDPALVVTDHGPTALLAARSLRLPCARIGTGFCCPPALDPEPPLLPNMPPAPERSRESGALVLASINTALQAAGGAPLATLGQMHRADEDFVTTYAELDHYRLRPTPRWGVLLGSEDGVVPVWPAVAGPRVFVYLKPGQAQTLPLLRVLGRMDCSTLVYCPGLAPDARDTVQGGALRFSEQPLEIGAVTAACDLVVCNAGHGTVCAALLACKPLLMVPEMLEQGITAHRVADLGAGLVAEPDEQYRLGELLTRLLTEPGFTHAAHDFSVRHDGARQAQIVQGIAERCLQLCA